MKHNGMQNWFNRLHIKCHALNSLLVLVVVVAIGGCTFLPSSGPSLSRVKSSAHAVKDDGSYVLIPLRRNAIEVLNRGGAESFQGTGDLTPKSEVMQNLFRQGAPSLLGGKPTESVVQGDVVNVSIYDSGGSLFATPILANGLSQTGAIQHDLPPQLVDGSGEIMVPYAGRILVRGRSLAEIQEDIQDKLKGKTVDPQVVVTISNRIGGNTVSILGDVKTPAQVPVSLAGTRLLDALAAAGGSTGHEYETIVSVNRGGVIRAALLSEIFEKPSKNIFLHFGDTIIVRVRAENFLSFGANGNLAEVPFDDDHLTLAKALAKVGGANDNQANPSAILVYRLEPVQKVIEMGYKPVDSSATTCPVIYRLDLTQADGFFVARNFSMRDHDIIYTTSAGSVGLRKFLSLIGSIFAPVSQAGGATAGAASAALAL